MNPVKILTISFLVGAAALSILIVIVCAKYEKYHPEDVDQWEDITDGSED